jgi:hypothetical protein
MAKSSGTRETQARISILQVGKMRKRSKPERQARRNFLIFVAKVSRIFKRFLRGS